jgi:hypothetical protein
MNLDLLNPHLGVQSILAPPSEADRLPGARPLANNTVGEAGLNEFYHLPTMNNLIAEALKPQAPDDEFLRPDIFSRNVRAAFEELKSSRNKDVRRFVRDDLEPLLEDVALLRTFTGLLMDG